MIMMAAVENN